MELESRLLIELYRKMRLIRTFEDAVSRLYRQGKVLGGVYSGNGQEAITAGACLGLRKTDLIAPVHRDVGAFLVKGTPPDILMAQIMGRKTGPSGGRDSWTHTGDPELGIIGTTSIMAAFIPICCGVALALKMQRRDDVVLCFFGEGATARGDFHEGLNFAGIHKLPVVFVCENNQYAYSTPWHRESPLEHVADRAPCYGMVGEVVDGNDPVLVYKGTQDAVARARRGEGATLLECKTYRMHGHSEHDPAMYQPASEKEEWKQHDPILRYEACLTEMGLLNDENNKAITAEVEQAIREAVEIALNSPFPEGEEALEGLFVD